MRRGPECGAGRAAGVTEPAHGGWAREHRRRRQALHRRRPSSSPATPPPSSSSYSSSSSSSPSDLCIFIIAHHVVLGPSLRHLHHHHSHHILTRSWPRASTVRVLLCCDRRSSSFAPRLTLRSASSDSSTASIAQHGGSCFRRAGCLLRLHADAAWAIYGGRRFRRVSLCALPLVSSGCLF